MLHHGKSVLGIPPQVPHTWAPLPQVTHTRASRLPREDSTLCKKKWVTQYIFFFKQPVLDHPRTLSTFFSKNIGDSVHFFSSMPYSVTIGLSPSSFGDSALYFFFKWFKFGTRSSAQYGVFGGYQSGVSQYANTEGGHLFLELWASSPVLQHFF